jgi:ATP-dependent protease HslVU (ClpYQ) peptidase subunit
MSLSDDAIRKPKSHTVAEHIAMGDWLIARSSWQGNSPDNRRMYAEQAMIHFAAATAKATVAAVFEPEFEAEIDATATEMAETRQKVRDRVRGEYRG